MASRERTVLIGCRLGADVWLVLPAAGVMSAPTVPVLLGGGGGGGRAGLITRHKSIH